MTGALASDLRTRAERLLSDLPYFTEHCLKIRPKAGGLVPLILNRVQLEIHARLEQQLRDTGRVRALILKARQPGCSTYVEARYFHRITQTPGTTAFILTHGQAATENIFGIGQRFHENLPEPLALKTVAANSRELHFDGLDSGIQVSTAGAKGAGRASTLQYIHGSEVAHWENATVHMGGLLQAVPDAPGTEVILESTANGLAGLFYDMCKAAERGGGDYQLIFIPWHWHDEYQTDPPEGWTAPRKFVSYGEAHELTPAQVHWAWRKNAELAAACNGSPDEISWLFRQEYPATGAEAFQAADHDAFIPPELALAARKFEAPDQSTAALVLGVDVARGGRDKTRIVDRQGRRAGSKCDVTLDTRDLMQIVGRVAREIDRLDPAAVFVDGTGIGAGVFDRLKELGHKKIHLVNFGGKPHLGDRFANKRAEMWDDMAKWLSDGGGADIPDRDEWQASLCAPGYAFDSSSRLQMEAKDKIRARIGFSPDVGDALALTFAESAYDPVLDMSKINPLRGRRGVSLHPHSWMRV
jgi:hypothetical protein